jgi:hypothetical protein
VAYLRGRAGVEVDVKEAMYGGMINLVASVLFCADIVNVGLSAPRRRNRAGPASARGGAHRVRRQA